MKKGTKRLISILLSLTLIFSVAGASVFAADTSGVSSAKKVYKTYTVLGDSIPTGYGIVQDVDGKYWSPHGHYVYNAYPEIVEQTLGVENFNILARSGLRTVETLRMIEPSVYDTWSEDDKFFSDFLLKYLDQMTEEEIAHLQAVAYDQVKNADLITINLANNDILSYSSMKSTIEYMNGTGQTSLFTALGVVAAAIKDQGSAGALLATLISNGVTIGFLGQYMMEGFLLYMQNWNTLIKKIREINPDAEILAIGMYNPFTTLKLTDSSLLEIGRAMDPIIQMVNVYLKYGSEMRDEYTFVDVMGTEAFEFPSFFDPTVFANFTLNVHPTVNGHAYMAEKILNTLGSDAEGSVKGKTFTVNVPENADGGTVTTTKSSAKAGEAVTVSVKEDATHDFESILMVDGNDNTLMVAPDAEGNYNFNMPSSDVVVTAKFKKCPSSAFSDLDCNAWYHEETDFVLEKGYMAGVSSTSFAPEANLTRGMIVQMLYAMSGKPDTELSSFKDVGANRYYAKAIGWASANGIVSGFEDETFRPEDDVTREQLATILKAYADYIEAAEVTAGDLSAFPDGDDVHEYAKEAVAWAVGAGLISGRADGSISPTATATRAEVAQMVTNFCAAFAA